MRKKNSFRTRHLLHTLHLEPRTDTGRTELYSLQNSILPFPMTVSGQPTVFSGLYRKLHSRFMRLLILHSVQKPRTMSFSGISRIMSATRMFCLVKKMFSRICTIHLHSGVTDHSGILIRQTESLLDSNSRT